MSTVRVFQNFEELLDFFEDEYGNNILFSRGDEVITYKEFSYNVKHLKHLFRPRIIYVLAVHDPILFAQAYYSCILAGGIAYLSFSDYKPFDKNSDFRTICDSDIILQPNQPYFHTSVSNPEVVCTIAFSSGTTADKKGVMLSQKNLLMDTAYTINRYLYWQEERLLHVLPYHHLFGLVGNLLAPLHSGSHVHIPTHPLRAMQEVFSFKPDVINLPPAFINALISIPEFSKLGPKYGGPLRKVMCAGSAFDTKTAANVQSLGIIPCTAYGMTECSSCASVTLDSCIHLGTVGKEIGCINLTFSPQHEILISGETVMLGYFNNEDATKHIIRDGWLYTGDLGYRNKQGEIVVTGRKDNILVLPNGLNCSPELVEQEINSLPGVKECVLVPDKKVPGKIVVIIVKGLNLKVDTNSLRNILLRYGIDNYYIIIREKDLPRNSLGKVMRNDFIR